MVCEPQELRLCIYSDVCYVGVESLPHEVHSEGAEQGISSTICVGC